MNWPLIRSLAIKAAPVVLGVVLGVGGTKAVDTKPQTVKLVLSEPIKVDCPQKVIIQKPDPLKVEFIKK